MQLFFDLYAATEPPRSNLALQAIVQLAAVRRSLFSGEKERTAFLQCIMTSIHTIMFNLRRLSLDLCSARSNSIIVNIKVNHEITLCDYHPNTQLSNHSSHGNVGTAGASIERLHRAHHVVLSRACGTRVVSVELAERYCMLLLLQICSVTRRWGRPSLGRRVAVMALYPALMVCFCTCTSSLRS